MQINGMELPILSTATEQWVGICTTTNPTNLTRRMQNTSKRILTQQVGYKHM